MMLNRLKWHDYIKVARFAITQLVIVHCEKLLNVFFWISPVTPLEEKSIQILERLLRAGSAIPSEELSTE